MSYPRLIAVAVCLLLIMPHPAFSALDKSAELYKKAAKNYYRLVYAPEKFPRSEWMKAVRLFKDIYTQNPGGKKTPEALFMTGRIYQFIYLRFGKNSDKQNAITIFRVLVRSYPVNVLADDALFRTGELHEEAGNHDEALAAYRGVLRWFPTGDMSGKSKKAMARIMEKSGPKVVKAKKPKKKRGLSEFKAVRYWSSDSYARVVFDLGRIVNYRVTRPKAGGVLVVDLLGTRYGKKIAKSVMPAKGPVKSVRVSNAKNGITRIKIALNKSARYTAMELSNPARIVLDFHTKSTKPGMKKTGLLARSSEYYSKSAKYTGKTPPKAAGLMKPAAPAPDSDGLIAAGLLSPPKIRNNAGRKSIKARKVSLSETFYSSKTIVIDPGHGGRDPGAVSKSGLREKDVALDIGLRLKKILKRQCKCRVLMTRTRDVFIPLEERTAFANTKNADLFISIHLNANTSSRARGVETYFLSPALSRNAMYTAARENMLALGSDDQDMNDLAFILSDMKNTDKINESSKMAGSVQSGLVSTLSKKYKVRNHGVKSAMFYVLHGARMPSILVETAFITNRTEEKRLRSPAFRELIAKGIAGGVKDFVRESRFASIN